MNKLKRQFGLGTATALIIGQVIAVGIFLTPAGMAKAVQSPFWLFAIWIVVGAATLCGALSYAELAARFPAAGGPYVFLREAFGQMTAFLFGWVVLLVIDPGLTAAFAVGLAGYASYLYPLTPFGQTLLAISVVIIVGLINIRGAKLSAGVLKGLIAVKIGALVLLIVFGFLGGNGDWNNFVPFFEPPKDWLTALAGGFVGAYFAFAGWWEVTRLAGEIKDPAKNVPRALVLGVGTITVLYLLTSAVFYYLVPVAEVANETTFAAQAGEALFGVTGGAVFSVVVIISVLGTIFAYLMASPRVYYAMAENGVFFPSVGRLHESWGTPHRAILIQVTLACILITTGSFNDIVSYFFFVAIIFIAITVAGLFVLRRNQTKLETLETDIADPVSRNPQPIETYRTPIYPFTPIFFLFVTAIVSLMLLMKNPIQSLVGVGVVLVGIPVYLLIFRKRK